ncbi:condensation domain-containing protein [Streptomyces sp. NPDC085995]|uniref:condensation domain-containing protein n=1 Tax=Streptomyces sp. NPDC085995 TaxID=3154861 RepID=UPI00341AEAED
MTTDADPTAPDRQLQLQRDLLLRARSAAARRTPAAEGPAARSTVARDARLPLSRAQRRMWLTERLGGAGDAYHVPFATRVRGPFDPDAFADALTALVARHGILRTRYAEHDGEPCQTVLPAPRTVPAPVADAAAADAPALLRREAARPFDLAAGEAVRALVLRHGPQDHTLLLTFHHIAIDGGSLETVAAELAALYAAAVAGTGQPPLPAAPQYADHACREHDGIPGLRAALDRWSGLLADAAPPRLPRPTRNAARDAAGTAGNTPHAPAGTASRAPHAAAGSADSAPRPAAGSAAVHAVPLAAPLPEALRVLGAERRATLFAVSLTAAFGALHRLTGDDDLVIGVAGTHRGGTAMRGLVGLCVNTLPVRVSAAGDPSFAQLLGRVRDALLEAQRHRHIPFDLVLERLGGAARGADGTALVRVTADVLGEPTVLRLPGTSAEYVEVSTGRAKFTLSYGLELADPAQPVALVQYDRDVLDDAVATATARDFAALLTAAAADPERPLSEVPGPDTRTGVDTHTAAGLGTGSGEGIGPDTDTANATDTDSGHATDLGNATGTDPGHDAGSGPGAGDTEPDPEARQRPGGARHPAEVALRAHPQVADAVVVEPAEGPAVAYAVLRDSVGPARHELLALLRRSLPPEAVPATVTPLDALPHTATGALDHARLPGAPAPSAPQGPRAGAVTEAFAALLGVAASPDDDFFALGGHSLVAVRLAEQLRAELELPLTGLDVLQARTPRALTALLDERAARQSAARAARGPVRSRSVRPGTVLVTGATGGVGAFVLRELAARGRPVLALARPESAHLITTEGVDVMEGDLTDLAGLREAVAGADAIVHAACTFTRHDVDVAATEAMVDAWRRGPFVFVSSVDAYGHPEVDDVSEELPPHEPVSPYGRAKLECEARVLRAAGTEGRGGASAVRSPIVWGAHDRLREQLRWGAVGGLYQAARRGGPIELPRPGAAGHAWYGAAWVHAAALARAVAECLDRPVHGVANACSGHVSWRDLADDLTRLLGTRAEFRETDEVPRDFDHRWHYAGARLAGPLRPRPGEERRTVLAEMIAGMTHGDDGGDG